MLKTIKIGLFGFGCVGQGLYDVLNKSKGIKAEIIKTCVKTRGKIRTQPDSFFTFDSSEILKNPDINLVVELINNVNDALLIVKESLNRGKNVVSANKKMLAYHLEELVELQEKNGVSLLYEASSCGSIPIIRNLEEYYDNELLYSVSGVFNGSSNYILTKVFDEGLDYQTALKSAQNLGFAESDPSLDVEGYDSKYKLVIITAHSYGLFINPDEVFNYGINNLSPFEIQYAKEKGFKIKLVASVKKIGDKRISLLVIPQFVKPGNPLYTIDNENNGVAVEAAFADKQFFFGKGAGGHPTGAAVLSDISANRYAYRYEYKKRHQQQGLSNTNDYDFEIYLRYKEESLPGKLKVRNISERFQKNDYRYLIGTVNLEDLIRHRLLLNSPEVFIAGVPNSEATHLNKQEALKAALFN